jgi:hypothetical protein
MYTCLRVSKGYEYIRAASCFRSSSRQRLVGGQLATPPFIPAPLSPSPGIILACPLSPSSRLPSSFLNLCSSDLPYNTSSQIYRTILLSTPPPCLLLLLLLVAAATPCCTQDQFIYSSHLVFLSFAPLVVVSANGVVFFFLVVLMQVFCLLLIAVSNSIVCY